VLPFIVNVGVKLASALQSKQGRRAAIEDILRRNKPAEKPDLLSQDQVTVLDGVVGQTNLRVTTTGTLIGSMIALIVIAWKSSQPWLWLVVMVAAVVAFVLWYWTNSVERYSDKKLFSWTVGQWALIGFCMYDVTLAVLSVVFFYVTAHPPVPCPPGN